MKARNMTILLAIGFLIFGAVSANAQKGMVRGGSQDKQGAGMQGECRALDEMLDLTPDQIKQMKDSRLEIQKKIIPLQADLKLARLELDEMIRNGASKSAVDSKIDEIGGIRSQIQKIRIGHKIEMLNMLTDEQKEKLESMPMGGFGHCGWGQGLHGLGFRDGDCPRLGEGGHGHGRRPGRGDCPRSNGDI